jgi:type I restriction enzyme R subunit
MSKFTESDVEESALYYFEQLGYTILGGGDIALSEPQAERTDYKEVILEGRFRSALAQINPQIPITALDEVVRQVLRSETQNLFENNRRFHRLLTDGVPVSYQKGDHTVHDQAWLIDWHNPENNDWFVVNQFTVIENQKNHRPDIVVFVNGLPLAVIELKNAADENADIDKAYNQLQTYKNNIPSLFTYNEALIVSDGIYACIGSITSDRERFMPWRTIDGSDLASKSTPELEVVIGGVFEKTRFLDLIRFFIVFEVDRETITKKWQVTTNTTPSIKPLTKPSKLRLQKVTNE